MARIWNDIPELCSASTIGTAKQISLKWAKSLPGASTKDIRSLGRWVGFQKLDIAMLKSYNNRPKSDMGKYVGQKRDQKIGYPLWMAP